MTPDNRRYFAYNRLYFEVWRNLPTMEQRDLLQQAIGLYGFEKIKPDFKDDEILQNAWNTIIPDLSFSWEQKETGSHGGNMSAKAKSSKTNSGLEIPQKDENMPQSMQIQPFPDDATPKQAFIDFLNKNNLNLLATAPKPLTGEQMRWFVNVCGEVLAYCLVITFNAYLKQHGGDEYWLQSGMENKSVGSVIHSTYLQMQSNYDEWLAATFPNVAKMGARKLSFAQYQNLRSNFGRSNLLIKLSQLDKKKTIYKNATAFATINNWIKASMIKPTASKYHLPSFDDDPDNANLIQCTKGYDDSFYLYCYRSLSY